VLSEVELHRAEDYWYKQIQLEVFPAEMDCLQQKDALPLNSRLLPFAPTMDPDGLLRVGGRLRYAELSEMEKHPALLASHPLTELLILEEHRRALHGGVRVTLARLRSRVWILQGRKVVQAALKGCGHCQQWQARPGQVVEGPVPGERMIGTVKQHLRRTLGKALLSSEELRMLLIEVEAVVNSRPLTYIYNNPEEGHELTPAHFLIGRSQGSLQDVQLIPSSPGSYGLMRRWNHRKILMDGFWHRWKQEYLLQLRSFHQVAQPVAHSVQLGDAVLIADQKTARGQWKLAIVTELTPRRDQNVRSVVLRDANRRTLRRALRHVYPLEVLP
jgi:hypothetical protein